MAKVSLAQLALEAVVKFQHLKQCNLVYDGSRLPYFYVTFLEGSRELWKITVVLRTQLEPANDVAEHSFPRSLNRIQSQKMVPRSWGKITVVIRTQLEPANGVMASSFPHSLNRTKSRRSGNIPIAHCKGSYQNFIRDSRYMMAIFVKHTSWKYSSITETDGSSV